MTGKPTPPPAPILRPTPRPASPRTVVKRPPRAPRPLALALARAARLRMLRNTVRNANCPEQRAAARAALMREVSKHA